MKEYPNIRFGKDIQGRWPILTNGQPESLEGKDLTLLLTMPCGKRMSLNMNVQETNKVVFDFPGILHEDIGLHSITLWENLGKAGQTCVDNTDAFALVTSTDEESESAGVLDTVTVDLTASDMIVGIKGNDGVGITSIQPVSISTISGGSSTYRITLSNGNTFDFSVTNGAEGSKGQNGANGSTPVITASKTGSTTTLYVNGTPIATITDGLNGNNGSNGVDGTNGSDGHSPVVTATKVNGVTTIYVDGTAIGTINDGTNGSNYILTDADKTAIANITKGLITIPSKVSELENDSNYLTQHQDISGKQDKLSATQIANLNADHSQYVTKVTGKGLSTNDYTNEDKSAVQNIESLSQSMGDKASLNTTNKTSLVNAINEVNSKSIPTKTSQLQNDSNFLTSHQDVSAKLQVDEVKTNGNIVLKDGSGNKKEYMAATPSGDPLHHVYINAGALYNDTNADIVRSMDWGQGETENVTHKKGMWYLNGLGDISTDEMRNIYVNTFNSQCIGTSTQNGLPNAFANIAYGNNVRTNFEPKVLSANETFYSLYRVCQSNTKIEVFALPKKNIAYCSNIIVPFSGATALKHIIGIVNVSKLSNLQYFTANNCTSLISAFIYGVKDNTTIFAYSPNINKASILYMIQNANNTTDITITLHATVYANAMADAEIVAAAEAKNISLASA